MRFENLLLNDTIIPVERIANLIRADVITEATICWQGKDSAGTSFYMVSGRTADDVLINGLGIETK